MRAAEGKPVAQLDGGFSAEGGFDDPSLVVVGRREQFLSGTEPHSPGTWGHTFDSNNARVTMGNIGVGIGFLPSPVLGRRGIFRMSFLADYMNQTDFPVRNAQNIRSGIVFAASMQPFDWGEVYVSYAASANTNNRTSPNLIQALGDFTLGIKAGYQFAKGFHAGADLRLLSFSGVGNQGLDRFAFGFRPTAMVAYDFRALNRKVPLIVHAQFGVTLDSSGGLVTTQRLNASEEFALAVNRFNRFNFGAALEVPLPIVTPFIEYSLGAPLLGSGITLLGPDGIAVDASAAMAQNLGLGLKITALKDVTFMTGVNLGLARSVALGIPATPPWVFFIGASFAVDPFQRGETKLVETIRERKVEQAVAAKTARIDGIVLEVASREPVPGAIITIGSMPPAATNGEGRFSTRDLTDSKVTVHVTRDGFKPKDQDVTVEPGKPTVIEVVLEQDIKRAMLDISANSTRKPVKGANIAIKGTLEASGQTDELGTRPFEVPAGTYTVVVTADGYLAQTREVQVAEGGKMAVAFELVPVPKKSLVIFKGDKIEILQQVHFLTGKATIMADSFNLLQQVVDVIVKNNLKHVIVEGHTDNRGDKTMNQKLSEARAKAVADHLVSQGIEASRVEGVGYGDAKPVAPNLTARGRELNRRVEFIVQEK